ncbi:MAG TPA: hypothetical protein PLU10_08570 [Chitinophagaceae bacterium]|nr:hypothetical protein [Chitinophagaceae bacterium]
MAILTSVLSMVLPWWILSVVCFLGGLLAKKTAGISFIMGFIAITLSWGSLILWLDIKNKHILSTRLASVFPLGGNPVYFILVSILIGSLLGGLSCLSGSLFAQAKSTIEK